jgi:hypothetical protein
MPVQGRQDDDEEGGGGGGAGDACTSSVAVGRAPRVSMRSTAASTLPPAANRADTQAPRSCHPISAINASSSVNRASYCVQSTGAAADAAGAGVAGAGVIEDGNPKLRPGMQGNERGEPRISQPHAARTMARARPKATAAPAVSHPCLGPSTQAAAGGKWQVRDTGGVEVRDGGGWGAGGASVPPAQRPGRSCRRHPHRPRCTRPYHTDPHRLPSHQTQRRRRRLWPAAAGSKPTDWAAAGCWAPPLFACHHGVVREWGTHSPCRSPYAMRDQRWSRWRPVCRAMRWHLPSSPSAPCASPPQRSEYEPLALIGPPPTTRPTTCASISGSSTSAYRRRSALNPRCSVCTVSARTATGCVGSIGGARGWVWTDRLASSQCFAWRGRCGAAARA